MRNKRRGTSKNDIRKMTKAQLAQKLKEELNELGVTLEISDNGGKTFDRYTIIVNNEYYITASKDPLSPLGFFQHGDYITYSFLRYVKREEKPVSLEGLPERLLQALIYYFND